MNIFITPLSDKAAPVLQTKPIGSATAHLRFKRGSSVPLTVTLLGVTEAGNLRIGMKRRDRYESPLLAYAAAASPDEPKEGAPAWVRFTLLLHVNSEELDNALGVGAGDKETQQGTGNVLWNYAVLDASLVLPGYLKKIELKCRTTGSPAGAFFPGVYQQPLGGGSDPSAWTFLGASTNSLTQSYNAWVEWAFPDGLELAEGRPIALMAMATATAGWTMDTQIGGRSVARGGEQPPARKTLERQRQFYAG